MSIVEYEQYQWREHQSKMTSFLSFLEKNKDNIIDKNGYVLRLIQLNELFNQAENIVNDIKYECIYPQVIDNQKKIGKNSKRYATELKEHQEMKSKFKTLAVLSEFI